MNLTAVKPVPYFGAIFRNLTRPHVTITSIEERRQATLLSGLMIALVVMSMIASILLIWTNGEITRSVQVLWVALAMTLVQYGLVRTGRYGVGSKLFIGFNFVVIYLMPAVTDDLSWLLFATMNLLLSAMLLNVRWTTSIFFIGIGLQLAHANLYPLRQEFSNFSAIVIMIVTGPLVLVFINHRTNLERERQQELREANLRLRESEASLEKRVAEQTNDLRIAASVSRQITNVLDLDELLPKIVELTRSGYDLYHVSIFLYEASVQQLNLQASIGRNGVVMERGSRAFDLNGRGLVPTAARHHQAQRINDVDISPDHIVNPLLPKTQSELAVPMVRGSQLIGVMDLQSETKDRFSEDEARVLQTLAEQIAIAVINAQLYGEQVQVAEELREVDEMKSQFLASMSHELRTPLNSILTFTELMAVGTFGDVTAEQVDYLSKSLNSGRHLLSLINDVLDITKIQSGMMKLFIEDDFDIVNEVEQVAASVETLLADKPVELILDIDRDFAPLTCDKRRVRQVLLNLLSNAIKFTDEGTITLSVKKRPHEVLFAVIDTGPGISAEQQAIIFEPFVQTETGIKHAGGTGLGLPISKQLVQAHGGQLTVESNLNEGTAFYFNLPIHAPTETIQEEMQVG